MYIYIHIHTSICIYVYIYIHIYIHIYLAVLKVCHDSYIYGAWHIDMCGATLSVRAVQHMNCSRALREWIMSFVFPDSLHLYRDSFLCAQCAPWLILMCAIYMCTILTRMMCTMTHFYAHHVHGVQWLITTRTMCTMTYFYACNVHGVSCLVPMRAMCTMTHSYAGHVHVHHDSFQCTPWVCICLCM